MVSGAPELRHAPCLGFEKTWEYSLTMMRILWGYYGDIMVIIFWDNHFVGMKKETFW